MPNLNNTEVIALVGTAAALESLAVKVKVNPDITTADIIAAVVTGIEAATGAVSTSSTAGSVSQSGGTSLPFQTPGVGQ